MFCFSKTHKHRHDNFVSPPHERTNSPKPTHVQISLSLSLSLSLSVTHSLTHRAASLCSPPKDTTVLMDDRTSSATAPAPAYSFCSALENLVMTYTQRMKGKMWANTCTFVLYTSLSSVALKSLFTIQGRALINLITCTYDMLCCIVCTCCMYMKLLHNLQLGHVHL